MLLILFFNVIIFDRENETNIYKRIKRKKVISLIFLLLVFLCRIFPYILDRRYIDEQFFGNMVFILPFLFSLFFGSLSFGEEFNQKTEEFILSKPIKVSSIFWIKFLSGVILTLFLTLITYLAFNNYLISFIGKKLNTLQIVYIFLLPVFFNTCILFSLHYYLKMSFFQLYFLL